MIKAKNLKIKFGLILATLLTLGLSFNNSLSSIFNVEEAVINDESYEPHNYTDSKRADGSTLADDHGDHNDFTEISPDSIPSELTESNYFLKDDITITSEFEVSGDDVTLCLNGKSVTASSEYNTRLFNVAGGKTFRICDCGDSGEIKGGSTSNGGAIYVNNSGKLYLDGGTITENTASGNGGAIYLGTSTTFEMTGGTISQNTAVLYGGAVFTTSSSSSLTISGGKIADNKVLNDDGEAFGGAIAARGGSNVYVSGETIISNNVVRTSETSQGFGGGIFIGGGTLEMSGGTISENTANGTDADGASGVGGGVYLNTGSQFTMSGGYITSNYAAGGSLSAASSNGSGVLVEGSVFSMNGGQISDNKLYDSASLETYESLVLSSGNTGGVSFNMTGGYLSGDVSIRTNEYTTNSIEVSGGYLGESANTAFDDYVSDNSISVYIGDSDKQTAFDDDYRSGFPYAIYQKGEAATYAVTVDGDVCIDTDFTNYIKFNGQSLGDSVSYTYGNGNQGLPTTIGTHTISYTINSEHLDSSTAPKTYYGDVTGTFEIEIKDHQLEYNKDDEGHWYECQNTICDYVIQSKEDHTYSSWTHTKTSSGYDLEGTCSANCGQTTTIQLPAIDSSEAEDTYNIVQTGGTDCTDEIVKVYQYQLSSGEYYTIETEYTGEYGEHSYTYASDETQHWQLCTIENVIDENSYAEHTFSTWTAVDDSETEEESSCDVCGYQTTRTISTADSFNWLWFVVIILGIVLFVNIIIAIILLARRRRKRQELEEQLKLLS